MIPLTLIALIRIVPYLFAAVNAWTKGYKRLTLAMVYVTLFAVANFAWDFSAEVSGLLSSFFAFLLLLHALDLKPKQRR